MTNDKFWLDVLDTFQALPPKMKLVWFFAPPMCALLIIAYFTNCLNKNSLSSADPA